MAIKKMLVLSGVANAGKTNTLNLLAEKIHGLGHQLLDPPSMPPTLPDWRNHDHRYVFEVVKQSGTQVVGIDTHGDDEDSIQSALEFFTKFKRKVDVIILASRSYYSATVATIENWRGLGGVIPDYTALMHKQGARYSNSVQGAIADRFYNKI